MRQEHALCSAARYVFLAAALCSSPAAASEYQYNVPPFKITCVGKLQLDGNSKSISLDTEMMHGKKFNDDAIPCAAPIYVDFSEKVRSVCALGDVCRIDGMIKGFSHDIYEWTKINTVIKSGARQ